MSARLAVIRLALALAALALAAPAARAGRPMTVDDAALLPAGSCQLESWLQNNRGSRERWLQPSCNVDGKLELALGGARVSGPLSTGNQLLMQGKTLLKPLDDDGWGAALSFGNQASRASGMAGDLNATLPFSFAMPDERYLLHSNLGWVREKLSKRNLLFWGTGLETGLGERTTLTSEVYGQNRGKPWVQLGIKHWLLVDQVQLDASCGERFGRHDRERFASIGLVLLSPSRP